LFGALLLQSASAQRAQTENRVLQVLDALMSDIDRDFDRDFTILHTLATSEALKNEDWRTFYDQAKAGLQGRAYLVLVDADGRQLVNTYVPFGEQPTFTGDPETVRRMLQTKAPVVSNLFVSLVAKKPVFNVSIPVLQNGRVRYVMSLGLLPDDLVILLTSQNLDPEWVTLIWDAKGVILARSRNNERYVAMPMPQNLRERDQLSVVRTTNLDGSDVLHATGRSSVSGWGVGVNIPYSLITGPMRNLLLLWAVAAVLVITIALALGLYFARQITTPLSVAARAAAAFGHDEPFLIGGSGLREADAFLTTLREAQKAREDLTEELKQNRDQLQAQNTALLSANEDLSHFAFAAFERSGLFLAVTEINARYIKAARYDDLLTVRCWVVKSRSRSLVFEYEIIHAETGEKLLTGSSTHICITRDGAIARIPEAWQVW
jgi:YbgC/YbaW family acyl-CoA thioester hydrolase